MDEELPPRPEPVAEPPEPPPGGLHRIEGVDETGDRSPLPRDPEQLIPGGAPDDSPDE
jgi:hypothetical protein